MYPFREIEDLIGDIEDHDEKKDNIDMNLDQEGT